MAECLLAVGVRLDEAAATAQLGATTGWCNACLTARGLRVCVLFLFLSGCRLHCKPVWYTSTEVLRCHEQRGEDQTHKTHQATVESHRPDGRRWEAVRHVGANAGRGRAERIAGDGQPITARQSCESTVGELAVGRTGTGRGRGQWGKAGLTLSRPLGRSACGKAALLSNWRLWSGCVSVL